MSTETPTTVLEMPADPKQTLGPARKQLSLKERAMADAEEAERIVSEFYNEGTFTFPTSKFRIPIRELPEAAYNRFFYDSDDPIPPPDPPKKKIKNDKGRDIWTVNYDHKGYKNLARIYTTHNANVRQRQAGQMSRYVIDKGCRIDVPPEWIEEYESELEDDETVSMKEMKYIFIVEQAHSNAELKALLISICGRDPLGYNVGDKWRGDDDDDD